MSAAGEEALTESGIAVGTPEYMSPEQGTGEPGIDGRTRHLRARLRLYEMLAGEPPFTGRTAQAIMARHRHDPIPSLRVVRPAVPPQVEAAVEKAMAKVPADRFATAAEFVEALEATPPPPMRHAQRLNAAVPAHGRRWIWIARRSRPCSS